jgi:hypothetical protein
MTCEMNDGICKSLEAQFKTIDPNASVLPGIGLPSQSGGVCTITHTMPGMPKMNINGQTCNSALCNNALFSTECAAETGKPLTLYEIMVPDVPGPSGAPSSAQMYINTLSRAGQMDVNASHYHWTGTSVPTVAVHHSSSSLSPDQFVNNTIQALGPFSSGRM